MSSPRFPHRTLLIVALAMATVGALATGYLGMRFGDLLLDAHAAGLALAAIACWAALDAAGIREKSRIAGEAAESQSDSTDEIAGSRTSRQQLQAAEARNMHPVFVAVPTGCVTGLLIFQVWSLSVSSSTGILTAQAAGLGLILLAASIVWLVFSKAFSSLDDLPEAPALSLSFREAQWAAWLVAAALLCRGAWPELGVWSGRVLTVWIVAVAIEQIARSATLWFLSDASSETPKDPFVSPIRLLLREAFLGSRNPLTSLFDTIENRFGLSLRSSWAIQFVRLIALPTLIVLLLFGWGLSGLQVVQLHQLGIEERFGRPMSTPLDPGLHVTWPYPFGAVQRFPVKTVQSMQIGFKEAESGSGSLDASEPLTTATGPVGLGDARALLWTKAHEEEFGLVLGSGSEIVAVNALVYFHIAEDPEGLFDYAYGLQNPVEALEVFAYQTMLQLTQSATLNDVLTSDRAGFARRFRDLLRERVEEYRLGIDVIDVSLINMHPPVEAAADYLDVISARLDATRATIDAKGERDMRLTTAASESEGMTAEARVAAARRVSRAAEESAIFVAADIAQQRESLTFRQRMWIETLEQLLMNKSFYLMDRSLLEDSGDVLLDLRPADKTRDIPFLQPATRP